MIRKKTSPSLLLLLIILGSGGNAFGQRDAQSITNPTPETIPSNTETASTLQTCQTHVDDLITHFKGLKKPRSKLLFFRSVRAKKYQVVKKNIEDFKTYVETKMTLLVGENAPQATEDFVKECTNYYRLLWDKILWIDNFNNENLRYFASHAYADTFFKKHNNIINKKIPIHERKSYEN